MSRVHVAPLRQRFPRLFAFNDVKPAWGQGVRGGLVWFVFLTLGILFGDVELGFQAGFMGWVVCYTDDFVGVGRRVGGSIAVTVLGAIATFIATLAGNWTLWSVVASVGLGFVLGLLGVLGPGGVKKSLTLMFLTLFAIGFPGDVTQGLELALATIIGGAGGLVAILISLPLDKGRDQRTIVSRQLLAFATFARALSRDLSDQEVTAAHSAVLHATDEANVDARYSVFWGGSGGLTIVYRQSLFLLHHLVAFVDARALTKEPLDPAMHQMMRQVGKFLEDKAEAVRRAGNPVDMDLTEIASTEATLASIDAVIAQLQSQQRTFSTGLGALISLRKTVAILGQPKETKSPIRRPMRFGATPLHLLQTALTHDTVIRRHLLRYAVAIGFATWLYKTFDIPDGFFIPLAINIMLQPDLGTGFSRLQIFSLGTIAGSVIGAFIGTVFLDVPMVIAVLTAITFFLLTAYIVVTYWAFAVGISVAIVATLSLLIPGSWGIGGWRIVDTIIGAVIVAVALLVLWPTRGRLIVPKEFGRVLNHHADYLQAVIAGEDPVALRRRVEMLIEDDNLLDSRMSQYSMEPRARKALVDDHQRMLLTLRRIRGSISNLSLGDTQHPNWDDPDAQALAESVVAEIRAVANAFKHDEQPEALPAMVVPDSDHAQPIDLSADKQRVLMAIGAAAQSLVSYLPRHASK